MKSNEGKQLGVQLGGGWVAFLLRPVLALCVRRSVKFQQLVDLLKVLMVEAARAELIELGAGASVSRISIMTGVHRKDVSRLLESGSLKPGVSESEAFGGADIFTRVVGQWCSHPLFSQRGKPRRLKCVSGLGEFQELVRSVSSEINPYTVLFELERLGMLKRGKNSVELTSSEYIPAQNQEALIEVLGEDMSALLSAAEQNIFSPDKVPQLHLSTRYDNICEDKLPEIRQWLLAKGAKFHAEARLYLAKRDKDLNPKLAKARGGARVLLGTFGLTEYLNAEAAPEGRRKEGK